MPQKFHARFGVHLPLDEVWERFRHRLGNEVFRAFVRQHIASHEYEVLRSRFCTFFGCVDDKWQIAEHIPDDDYLELLRATEAFYNALPTQTLKGRLTETISEVLRMNELDLGLSWQRGFFVQTGAELLDSALVNDPLDWLRRANLPDVLGPFEKGLKHYTQSSAQPHLYSDVITDMYEAMEAMAKAVTGRPTKDLSANMQAFLSKLSLTEGFRQLLKDYIALGNVYRHAGTGDGKPSLSRAEVEGFVYLTGTFLRLALVSLKS